METPTCGVRRGRFSKLLVTADHTTAGGTTRSLLKESRGPTDLLPLHDAVGCTLTCVARVDHVFHGLLVIKVCEGEDFQGRVLLHPADIDVHRGLARTSAEGAWQDAPVVRAEV